MKTGIYHCKSFSVPTRFYKKWADWFLRLQQEVGNCRLHVVYWICHLRNLVVLPHRTEEGSLNDDYDDLNHSFDNGWEIIVTKRQQKKNHKKIFLWCSEKKMCIINISYKRHFFPNITLIFREEKPTLQNFHNRHYSNLSLVLGKRNQFCKSTKSLPLSPLLYYYFIPLNM